MQELTVMQQKEIQGGGLGLGFLCIIIGSALYKIFTSHAGRISIPYLVSFDWR